MITEREFKHPQLIIDESGLARLRECIEFINTKRPELEENFRKQFWEFGLYPKAMWDYCKEHPNERMRLWKDFAPLSFYFEKEVFIWKDATKMSGEWKRDYNGGIIFHGSHDGGGDGGAPTFSVNLTPVDGWATHT